VVTEPPSLATFSEDASLPEQAARIDSTYEPQQQPEATLTKTPTTYLVVSEDMDLPGQQLSHVCYDAGVTLTVNRSEAAYHVRVQLTEANKHLWEDFLVTPKAASGASEAAEGEQVGLSPEGRSTAGAADKYGEMASETEAQHTHPQQADGSDTTAVAAGDDSAAAGAGAVAHPVVLHWGVENWQLPAAEVLPKGTMQVSRASGTGT
jgi:hypothetical protein